MIRGPLKNHAIVLRAEDLVQPDMDHWRKDANGQVLEKYQAAQKPIQALTRSSSYRRSVSTSSRATSTSSVISNDSRCTETNSSFVPIHQSWKCRPASRRRRSNFSATPPTRTSFSPARPRRRARPSASPPEAGNTCEEHRYTPDGFEPEPEDEDENAVERSTHHARATAQAHAPRRLERETSTARHRAIARARETTPRGEKEDIFARNHKGGRNLQGCHRSIVIVTVRPSRAASPFARRCDVIAIVIAIVIGRHDIIALATRRRASTIARARADTPRTHSRRRRDLTPHGSARTRRRAPMSSPSFPERAHVDRDVTTRAPRSSRPARKVYTRTPRRIAPRRRARTWSDYRDFSTRARRRRRRRRRTGRRGVRGAWVSDLVVEAYLRRRVRAGGGRRLTRAAFRLDGARTTGRLAGGGGGGGEAVAAARRRAWGRPSGRTAERCGAAV